MGNRASHAPLTARERGQVLPEGTTARAFAAKLAACSPNSVVVLLGAGVSVSAGIPDFRTPGTGLYDNLEKYNLPQPEAVFDIDYFATNPAPFYTLAKEMWPGNFNPTPAHMFVRLLQDKNLLKRCYTQNIDTLEREAGIDEELLVEAHGSFGSAHCISCNRTYPTTFVKQQLDTNQVPVRCRRCSGLVKPSIVFFGESLPDRFSQLSASDFGAGQCELVVVMGTSLKVHPFAGLVDLAPPACPRLLVNNQLVRVGDHDDTDGFRLDRVDNYRDVAIVAKCDDAVRALAHACGWGEELERLVEEHCGDSPVCPVPDSALDKNWTRKLPPLQPITPHSPVQPDNSNNSGDNGDEAPENNNNSNSGDNDGEGEEGQEGEEGEESNKAGGPSKQQQQRGQGRGTVYVCELASSWPPPPNSPLRLDIRRERKRGRAAKLVVHVVTATHELGNAKSSAEWHEGRTTNLVMWPRKAEEGGEAEEGEEGGEGERDRDGVEGLEVWLVRDRSNVVARFGPLPSLAPPAANDNDHDRLAAELSKLSVHE